MFARWDLGKSVICPRLTIMGGNVVKAVLDLLFPPLCIGCRGPVGEAGFCAACWSSITFLDGPGCLCCGLPFAVHLEGDALCAACLAKPPAFDTARAILAYDDNSRRAIAHFTQAIVTKIARRRRGDGTRLPP